MSGRLSNGGSFVYMLRGWQETGQAGAQFWRFSLEDPHTGVRRGFSNLAGLWAFLAEQLSDDGKPDEASDLFSPSP